MKMKRFTAFVAGLATLFMYSCEKDNTENGDEPGPSVSTTQIEVKGLENATATLVLADGSNVEISFDALGTAAYSIEDAPEVVFSKLITSEGTAIAIGRLSGGTIRFDYTDGKITHRSSDADGWIPIDIVEEFTIVKDTPEAMQKSYIQTADLYLGGIEWIPIGESMTSKFTGSFDGGGYKIHDLTINRAENKGQYSGLFGVTQNSTFRNITIASGNIVGFRYTAALAARTEGDSYVENCINHAAITGENGAAGLICNAFSSTVIHNCVNYGTLSGGNEIGGIVSRLSSSKITSCKNHGDISIRTGSCGGIVFSMYSKAEADDCFNDGTISGKTSFGGIAGMIASASKLSNSINEGTLIASVGSIGGVAGSVAGQGVIENCENKGNVTAKKAEGQMEEPTTVGGIVGVGSEGGIVTGCINHEKVEFTGFASKIGGIIGAANKAEIHYCENKAVMNYPEATTIGGIVGRNAALINFCKNHAAVTGKEYVGGIAGYNHDGMKVRMSANLAPVKGGNFTGGIAGVTWGSISACANKGSVEGLQYTGGLTGATAGEYGYLVASYNTGAVKGASEVGGVCGIVNLNGLVEACYSTGSVKGDNLVGGVCGSIQQSQLLSCYWSGYNGKGIGTDASEVFYFSDGTQKPADAVLSWPEATDKNWGVNPAGGEGTNSLWWKDLGKTGTTTYPALWWE